MKNSFSQPKVEYWKELEFFFEASLDMLCIASMDGFFRRINPSFSRLLGFSDEELLSKPFLDFVHPKDIEATKKIFGQMQQGANTTNFENRYRRVDGDYLILSWSAHTNSEQGLIYAIARDVTSERGTSNRLKEIQNALNLETIFAMTDVQGTIVEVNDKFCEISGYSYEELLGSNHRLVNSGKHPKAFFQEMWKTISAGKPWSGMIENRRKNGETYFVQSVIAPIRNEHGKIVNYIAVRFDTTAHMQRKVRLDNTLEILNETGAIAKVGGWELNTVTNELTWTDETFKILEVDKKDDQKPVLPEGLELFMPKYKPVIEAAVARAIEFGEPYSLELEAQTAKGNVIWIYTNGKANYEDGKIVSLSGTIQDINSRVIAEKKYALEKQKSIQNAKLASLGELAAGIAHEINNPLSIIHGTVQLMHKNLDQRSKLEQRLEDIENSSNRIAKIVSSLKKFSRTSEEKDFHPHCARSVINEAIILTATKSNRHHTPIEFHCTTEGKILCNDIEIEQVIVNLINNSIDAVKKMPDPWVKIELYEEAEKIFLRVTDAGLGIIDEISEKLFDPFFTTKEIGQGTGLGLSISKGILDEHDASLSIDRNAPNTCFVVTFNQYQDS
ncbi:MAG: PAS domain S-box protein [Sneathiella sp.]